MTRHFVLDALKNSVKPIVVFHNGTAQRGHTIDYDENTRYVYHHFNSGTADGAPTYFAETFLVHPMEFARELNEELLPLGINPPKCYCHPEAKVITPFDMIVDQITRRYMTKLEHKTDFGSCSYGSWCAVEGRFPKRTTGYTISDFVNANENQFFVMMKKIWEECLSILSNRGITITDFSTLGYEFVLENQITLIKNFRDDIITFANNVIFRDFKSIWGEYDCIIFENGQGLGLDVEIDNEWHTTSHTGIINPYQMIRLYDNFNAEVCYVTRSYLTRHGTGPLENEVPKERINDSMIDKTNIPNAYQGTLRYGLIDYSKFRSRIAEDYSNVVFDNRFYLTIARTHANEFNCNIESDVFTYISNNPFEVVKVK